MAPEQKDTDKKRAEYEEGLKKTVVPVIFGVVAAISSYLIVPDPISSDGLLIAILLILIQKFVYPFMHTKLESAKDWLYISFMTLFTWFMVYTLLLNF
ncbi:MAG TPA: hypothetical protein ENN68_02770 [Methanomicrobia archaeon]|nr:hypothetical protein [Methanomicrobia archaeon]